MPMMKAVIFDLDGTLLDTIEDIADSCNAALTQNGLRAFSVDEYKYFVGNGVDELIQNVIKTQQADLALAGSVKSAYLNLYGLHQRDKTRPYPGIVELLEGLNQAGIIPNVLSNKPDFDTQNIVAHFFPTIRFGSIYGKKPGYPVKPDPKSVNEIIGKLGLSVHEILYVGDTYTDMMTAKNANLPAIGVLWGFRKADELVQGGAWVLTHRPEEILAYAKGGISRADSPR